MATAAAALIDLDGLARRILLCPPGWMPPRSRAPPRSPGRRARLRRSQAAAVRLRDRAARPPAAGAARRDARAPRLATEWVLPTSGTCGPPKLAVHTLATLVGAIQPAPLQEWATFYDIRRYGGLQIFLRALGGRGSLRLSRPDEPVDGFLARLARRHAYFRHADALAQGAAERRRRRASRRDYVRLSGEIADDVRAGGPRRRLSRTRRIEHAYASTEAGVVFAVADGRAGFPAGLVGRAGARSR